jgi:cytochrome c6
VGGSWKAVSPNERDPEPEGGALNVRPIHALPVVLTAVALVGCGGGGSSGSTTSGSAAPATTQQSGSAPTTQSTPRTQAKPAPKTAPARRTAASGPDGGKVFASAGCASCHTLAAADASGGVGPNLDDLQPSFEAVRAQVTDGGGGMPSFNGQLSAAEIDAVAKYVAASAGK